jgi:hypothetical protein
MVDDPRGLVVPRDTSGLSESTRQWLAELPLQNTPSDVMARFARWEDPEDLAKERERESRRTASQVEREDMETIATLRGEVAETVTAAERLRSLAAIDEIRERNEELNADRIRAAELEARAVQREQRIRELEAELAREKLGHTRSERRAAEAIVGWAQARERAEQAEQQSGYRADSYSYPRYRANYWE